MVERRGFSFPVLVKDEEVAERFRVRGVLVFYLIDETGVVVHKGVVNTREGLEKLSELER